MCETPSISAPNGTSGDANPANGQESHPKATVRTPKLPRKYLQFIPASGQEKSLGTD